MSAGIGLALFATACSSDEAQPTDVSAEETLVPDETAIAPGTCDPSESIGPPEITTAGTTTLATLGVADFDCAGLNGDGYIVFNYNPVLIEGDDEIEVRVGDTVTAQLAWSGSELFTEVEPGLWSATADPASCTRLTIDVTSESGNSTATFGADIRVDDPAITCPQRVVDPSDPSDTRPDISSVETQVADTDETSELES